MAKNTPIIVKCAGGATAQLLALSNAIYLSIKINRPFKIKYYPYSTGTYWPFAIKELLEENELIEEGSTRGVEIDGLKVGEYIANFPLRRKGISYERFLQVIHRLHLNNILNHLRGEVVIGGKRKNLEKVRARTSVVSGNFVPLIDNVVFTKLSDRFTSANLPNPFNTHDKKEEIVIHYRLGDMRKMPSRDPKMGGHGVVDPITFLKVLALENINIDNISVKLVSDEPKIAVKLLKDVGISSTSESEKTSIWQDLQTISSAKIFIGSLSQFSFFGATVCALKGGKPYLPSKVYGEGNLEEDLNIVLFNYFECNYLQSDHYLFQNT
jgi:hypothetical protein